MHQKLNERVVDLNPQETAEWVESLDQVLDQAGPDRATFLLEQLNERARANGVELPVQLNTPYINTIRPEDEVPYPGDRAMERRIKSIIRWNAMAMVVHQNEYDPGIGGHISTYASLATLLEVGFNHFFHASYGDQPGDLIYFQGHASPGVYARAFLEGRDNLTFVINCNLQRLDGPVRGNGKVIQELEAAFRGAGWNVVKVIWGRDWD